MVHSLGGGAMIRFDAQTMSEASSWSLPRSSSSLRSASWRSSSTSAMHATNGDKRRSAPTRAALAGAETIEAFGDNFTGTADQWQSIVDQVKAYAKENFNTPANVWNGCTDSSSLSYRPDSGDGCISSDSSTWPALSGPSEDTISTRLRVRIPTKSFSTLFAGVTRNSSLSLQAAATATITRKHTLVTTNTTTQVAGGPCAICLLGPGLTLDAEVERGHFGDRWHSSSTLPRTRFRRPVPTRTSPSPSHPAPATSSEGPEHPTGSTPRTRPTTHHRPPTTPPCPTARRGPQCGVCAPHHQLLPHRRQQWNLERHDPQPGHITTSSDHAPSPWHLLVKSGISLSGNDLLNDGATIYFACSTTRVPAPPAKPAPG